MFQTDPFPLTRRSPATASRRGHQPRVRGRASLRGAAPAGRRRHARARRRAPGRPRRGDPSLKITPLPARTGPRARGGAPRPGHAGKWDAALPLPPAYERLADVFVALQQVGPLLRKRQQACTADIVCASVETMTGRRCSLAMLRSVEAVQPGTVSFSVRGGGSAFDPASGPTSPRRVRADVADPDVSLSATRRVFASRAVPAKDAGRQGRLRAAVPRRARRAGGRATRRVLRERSEQKENRELVAASRSVFARRRVGTRRERFARRRGRRARDGGRRRRGVARALRPRDGTRPAAGGKRRGRGVTQRQRRGPGTHEASRGESARERIANGERRATAPSSGAGAVPDDWHRGHAKDTADASARAGRCPRGARRLPPRPPRSGTREVSSRSPRWRR